MELPDPTPIAKKMLHLKVRGDRVTLDWARAIILLSILAVALTLYVLYGKQGKQELAAFEMYSHQESVNATNRESEAVIIVKLEGLERTSVEMAADIRDIRRVLMMAPRQRETALAATNSYGRIGNPD